MKRILSCVAVLVFLVGFRFWMVKNIEFTSVEHVLVYRSWSLAKYGVDEFGRKSPFLFGSAEGIQLPALTYLTTPITYFFGSSILSEQVIDFVFLLLPGLVAFSFGYGYLFAIMLLVNPAFFWPGNWEAKLLTALMLILWKFASDLKTNYFLIVAFLATLVISFDAWFLSPLILIIGYFYQNRDRLKKNYFNLLLLCSCLIFSVIVVSSNQNIYNHIKLNYFSYNQDVSILNSINTFRGQDTKLGFGSTSRLFHNKLQYIPVVLGQSLSFLSPSFLFATGDKNPESNSMGVPPYLSILLLLFAYSVFNSSFHEYKHYYIWLFITSLFIGSIKFPLSEQKVYLLTIPILLIITRSLHLIPKLIFNISLALGLINLMSLGILSGTVNSLHKEKCSLDLILRIVDVARLETYKNVLVSDDVCSDLGPGLALILAQIPVKTDDAYFRKNLRSIGKIKIVSPTDIVSGENLKNSTLILSEKLAKIVIDKQSETVSVKKQILYSSRNGNYSMFMIIEKLNETI